MKKITLVLLAALLALSLCACVAEEETPDNIENYAAPDYDHTLTKEQGGGTVKFDDGHAESAVIVGYTGPSTPHSVIIPSVITDAEREVTGIGDEAFYQLSTIKAITLPDTVTFIGKFAFAGCTSLETITIPASVTYIDENAFYGCTALKSIVFEGTELTEINNFAFLGCTALETISLPEGLESIGDYTFGNCTAIKEIKAPSTLKNIGSLAFYNCESLDNAGAISLSASIESIGLYAFSGINKENISAPEGSYAEEYVNQMAEEEVSEAEEETEA